MQFEYSLSGKWLELLKQVAPSITRAAVFRDQATTGGIGQFAVLQSVAPSVGIEVVPINVRDAGEIERTLVAFSRAPNRGLIATSALAVNAHRNLILALAARHRLPAVYPRRFFVDQGGLMSYGRDVVTNSRLAAGCHCVELAGKARKLFFGVKVEARTCGCAAPGRERAKIVRGHPGIQSVSLARMGGLA